MRVLLLALALLMLCFPVLAGAPPDPAELGLSEAELASRVREGRLGRDELIRLGRRLSYFDKLKLYYYARELAPYFEGVEDSFRDLARADPERPQAVRSGLAATAQAMRRARRRLLKAGRADPEADWRRGLLGLIFLDGQWRGRVYEKGKTEIKNPYDLTALVDCLDGWLRGRGPSGPQGCPARPWGAGTGWTDWQ
jgi:hypothetical protein